jgi:MFS family permease
MVGLVTLIYAVVGTAQHGWASGRTLLLLGIAGVLLAAFIGIESRGHDPLVPSATWRVRSLVSSAVVMLGVTGILVGAFYLNTLYLQTVLGYSAMKTGLSFLPLALVILAAAHLASRLLPHAGSRVVALGGLTLTAGGALLLAAAPDQASYTTNVLPGFLLLGTGVGLVFVAVTVTAMADVRHEQAGLASGIMTTAHELGAALGVAVLAAVAVSNGNPVSGYGDGFFVAATIAALLAVFTVVALPAVRPAAGTHASMH